MYDIITIGSATRDVYLISDKFMAIPSKKFPSGMGECVALGSKIEIHDMVLTTGGGATNAGATFGSLKFRTATITRIGDDSIGKDVIEDLSRFGVSTHLVRMVKGGETAYSTLLTMKDGERTALVYRGTSSTFTRRDIPTEALKSTKWIYLTSLGGDLTLAKSIITTAHKAGVHVMWNPGSTELSEGIQAFSKILPMIDVLNINLEEAQLLTTKKKLSDIYSVLHSDHMICVITDGTRGATAYRDGWMAHADTTGVKSISRTGAGDAFGSGFLAGLIKTEDITEALRIGTLNAESVILKHGAKNGLLTKWPSAFKKRQIKVSIL